MPPVPSSTASASDALPQPQHSPSALSQHQQLRKKRRVVPDEKRKRALFSCDRCKQRKIKCNRVKISGTGHLDVRYDTSTSCLNCTKAGTECVTQIPRKKRIYNTGDTEKLEFHCRVLEALVAGLAPASHKIDVKDTNQLINYGKSKKIAMPNFDGHFSALQQNQGNDSTVGINNNSIDQGPDANEEEDEDEDEDEDFNDGNIEKIKKIVPAFKKSSGGPESDERSKLLGPKLREYAMERMVYDTQGKPHYIGYSSTTALLNGLRYLVMKNAPQGRTLSPPPSLPALFPVHTFANEVFYNFKNLKYSQFEGGNPDGKKDLGALPNNGSKRELSLAFPGADGSKPKLEHTTSVVGELPVLAMASDHLPLWAKFPTILLIDREEADFYVDIFFEEIHPYYFIFSEDTFRERYQQFWQEIGALAQTIAFFSNHKEFFSEHERLRKILEIRKLPSNWSFCIYLVWVLAARFVRYPHGKKQLDNALISRYMSLVKQGISSIVLNQPSLLGIRILYLLAVHLHSCKNKNTAWILVGLALRQAMSLGLHRQTALLNLKSQRPISIQKQIWWSLYVFEVGMGCSFGRPSIINEKETNIGYPTDLYFKKGEEDYLDYYLENVKLTRLLSEVFQIRSMIYGYSSSEPSDYSISADSKFFSGDAAPPFSLKVIAKGISVRKKFIAFRERLIARDMAFGTDFQNLKKLAQQRSEKGLQELNQQEISFRRYRIGVALNYYCYSMMIGLPFILYTVSIVIAKPEYLGHLDEPIMALITTGVQNALEVSELLDLFNQLGILEGNLFADIYVAYVSTMILVLLFIMLNAIKTMKKNNVNVASAEHLRQQLKFVVRKYKEKKAESNKKEDKKQKDKKKEKEGKLREKIEFEEEAIALDKTIILKSIYRNRKAMTSDNIILGETNQRAVEVTQGLLRDMGILFILDKMFLSETGLGKLKVTKEENERKNHKSHKRGESASSDKNVSSTAKAKTNKADTKHASGNHSREEGSHKDSQTSADSKQQPAPQGTTNTGTETHPIDMQPVFPGDGMPEDGQPNNGLDATSSQSASYNSEAKPGMLNPMAFLTDTDSRPEGSSQTTSSTDIPFLPMGLGSSSFPVAGDANNKPGVIEPTNAGGFDAWNLNLNMSYNNLINPDAFLANNVGQFSPSVPGTFNLPDNSFNYNARFDNRSPQNVMGSMFGAGKVGSGTQKPGLRNSSYGNIFTNAYYFDNFGNGNPNPPGPNGDIGSKNPEGYGGNGGMGFDGFPVRLAGNDFRINTMNNDSGYNSSNCNVATGPQETSSLHAPGPGNFANMNANARSANMSHSSSSAFMGDLNEMGYGENMPSQHYVNDSQLRSFLEEWE